MTLIESAKKNKINELIRSVSHQESLSLDYLRKHILSGEIAVFKNKNHRLKKMCAVGKGLKTKINANIGTSTKKPNLKKELKKLEIAQKFGADTVMDLSVGGDLKKVRREVLKYSDIPVGTVPIYEAAVKTQKNKGTFLKMEPDELFAVLEDQAQEGVDFFTLHCGITRHSLELFKKNKRLLDIVSRGGAMLASWMSHNKRENPLYEDFDRVLDLAHRYDIVLSLGDALRPGSIFDATDKIQISELKVLGELTARAHKKNVQVIIEGPGHVPLNQIEKNVALEKKLCHKAPFYVLGPLVTDVASGYDHISSAIGGALAASFGADFLCYVTASEHLRHPSAEDVREGVIAARIAAHSADIVKGIPSALTWDREMSLARKKRNWQKQINFSIDPVKARLYKGRLKKNPVDVCTMCGNYCSIKLMEECLRV
ncbi:MAG: phosphomethylpyrimidine synthase ThiC [Candidatus Omnitrophica bacterium]|nr:phosphomethylpyrimidine synthase ThiC [Candidatus Omnitrophota bacterium]MDD5237127.1 phosphomethylpyrimidine synthase ThiC [Candidatus Omnitrophota bacterium]